MSNLLKDNKELMKKYNYKKNKDIDLNTLTIGTGKTIWWICDKGHEWSARVDSVSRGTGCPYCSGRKRIVGVNDIFIIHPDWKKYWNMKENNKNGINPYSLGCKSHVKVHWICSECGRKFSRDIVKMKDAVLCFDCANIIGKKINTKINY